MGSRIMHYCITTLLAKELNRFNKDFLLGGIAPDVHKYMKEPKDKSHFVTIDSEGNGVAKYYQFYKQYLKQERLDFHLGYFFHLITDDIWYKEIYLEKTKGLSQSEKKEFNEKHYRDFRRLNKIIIDHYELQYIPLEVGEYAIHEIDIKYLPQLVEDLLQDFEKNEASSIKDLEVLDMEEIKEFIKKP